jgi:hypothetical protein
MPPFKLSLPPKPNIVSAEDVPFSVLFPVSPRMMRTAFEPLSLSLLSAI